MLTFSVYHQNAFAKLIFPKNLLVYIQVYQQAVFFFPAFVGSLLRVLLHYRHM